MTTDAGRQETILIVDDEEDILEILSFHFKNLGMKVLTASNGREAFEIVQDKPVDLVISDVSMPEVNGEELLQMIRTQIPHPMPFFFISGNASYTRKSAQDKGAQGSFQKPFKFDDIDKIVKEVLAPQP